MSNFNLPNMVISPWNKTTKAIIPELPNDDSTYWQVKGGQAMALVWGHLQEQAARITRRTKFCASLKLKAGEISKTSEYPPSITSQRGQIVGVLSSCMPADEGWITAAVPPALKADGAPDSMQFWVPNKDVEAGRAILQLLEQTQALDIDRLQFALFGDTGVGIKVTGGLQIHKVAPFAFVHTGKKPVAALRVHKMQSFSKMSAEVKSGLFEIPGSRFWRMVEVERTADRELRAALRKTVSQKRGRR